MTVMARFVVVEGTSTPCSGFLRRGERQKFAVDDRLRKMVKIGCVAVVEGSLDGPDDDEDLPEFRPLSEASLAMIEREKALDAAARERYAATNADGPKSTGDKAPANNASRKKWAEFLTGRGIKFPDGDESKGELWAGRDDLIMIWQQASGGS